MLTDEKKQYRLEFCRRLREFIEDDKERVLTDYPLTLGMNIATDIHQPLIEHIVVYMRGLTR